MSRLDGSQGATVSISIDLELSIGTETRRRQERLELVTAGLLELLGNYGVPATWGVSNPALSAAREAILGSQLPHEFAVLGESIWLGNGTTHSRVAQEFERRFAGARNAGLAVSTLLLRTSDDQLDLNLLLDHGITAVRGPGLPLSQRDANPVCATRFGIWQVSAPLLVPLSGPWWHPERWTFRQRLKSWLRAFEPFHLVLDAGKMVELPEFGLPWAESLLRRLAECRDSRGLRIATLCDLARQDLSRRCSQPSRSVLAA